MPPEFGKLDVSLTSAQAMASPGFIPLPEYAEASTEQMRKRSREFCKEMARRRTVRDFDNRAVPRDIIEQCLTTAGSAPSGANQQPWRFVAVSDPAVKHRIREGAEAEEREFYAHRATPQWLQELAPLGTNADKPFLEIAPWLIAVFYETWALDSDGQKAKRYYPHESTGLACGLLIAALHHAGLATLTHTPSPMGFLNQILDRPKNEKPFLLLVTGYPAAGCKVPDIHRLRVQDYTAFK